MLEGRIVPAGDPTTTVLSSSAAAVDAGANLTLTALITDTAASPSNPAGTVTFLDGQATLTGVTTTTSIGNNQLQVKLATNLSSAGSHVLTASYNGDSKTSTSTSSVLLETVNQPLTIAFTAAEGSAAASAGAGAPVTLKGFSVTGNAFSGNNVALSSSTSGGANPALVVSAPGSSTNQFEGYVRLSEDGRYLTLAGPSIDANNGHSADASVAPRTIARIDVSGNVDYTTQDSSLSGLETNGAVSTDGTQFWDWAYTGAGTAVNAISLGGSGSTGLQSTYTSFVGLAIAQGQLYGTAFNPQVGDPESIVAIGTGTPTTSGQTVTLLPGNNDTFHDTGTDFVFLKQNPNITAPGPDTLYVADQNSNQGLVKYTFDGTSWNLVYKTIGNLSGQGIRDLVVIPGDNGSATIYALSADMTTLISGVDPGTGARPTFTTVPNVGTTNTITQGTWNGIALSPYGVANATVTTVSADRPIATSSQTVTLTADVSAYTVSSTPGSSAGDNVVFTVIRGGVAYPSTAVHVTASNAQGTGFAKAVVNAANFPTLPGGALLNGDQIVATFTPDSSGPFAAFGPSSSPAFTESIVNTATTIALAPIATTATGAVTATGSQTVVLTSLTGIVVGSTLSYDSGAINETITVTATNTTNRTITAVFAKTHATGVSVTLVNSPSPLGIIDGFTTTVTASSGSTAPAGTVTFLDNGQPFANVTLGGASGTSATATSTVQIPAIGTYAITAVYNGSATMAVSTSASTTQQVTTGNTTISLTTVSFPTTNPLETGVLGVTVTAGGTGYTSAPTVSFSGGGGSGAAATATISGGVVTSFTITNFGSGYTAAPSVTLTGGGGSGATATTTIGLPIASSGTTPITLNATVNAANTSVGFIPSGTLQFFDNGSPIGSPITISATATASVTVPSTGIPAFTAGTHTITASFTSSNTSLFNSTSKLSAAAPTITLVANGTSIALQSSINTTSDFTSGMSTPLTLTATVSPAGATGTVDFFDGNIKLNSSPVAVNGSGTATLNLAGGLASVTGTVLGAQFFGAIYVPTAGNTYSYAMTTTPILDPNTGAPPSTAIHSIAIGDTVVTQVGDGFTNNSALSQIYGLTPGGFFTTDAFLDEVNPVTHAIVQRIGLPDENVSGGATPIFALVLENNDTLEGDLQVSADSNGRYVTIAGIDQAPFTNAPSATAPGQFRTVGRLDLNTGILDTSTQLGGGANSAVNTDREVRDAVEGTIGNQQVIYVSGGASAGSQSNALYYVPFGTQQMDQPVLLKSGTPNSIDAINIFNGQLYVDTPFSPQVFDNVSPTGTLYSGGLPGPNLPVTDSLPIPGLSPGGTGGSGISGSTNQFVFFATGSQGANPDLLYLADRSNGLLKFSYNGTQWVKQGSFNTGLASPQGLSGYQDPVSGAFDLYATTGATGGTTQVVRIVDGTSRTSSITTTPPTLTVISTSGANLFYRGLALDALGTVAPGSFISPTSATFAVGSANTFTIQVTGFPVPDITTTSGSLPTGVTLNSAAGVLTGTPAAGTAGTYHITLSANNGVGSPITQSFTLLVLGITPTSLPNWTANFAYNQTITASGGTAPYTYSSGGTLPTGLSLNSSTGVLSGTPTATGSFAFTVTAKDSNANTITQSYTVVISSAVSITTTTLPSGTAGTAVSQTIAASGGTGGLTFSTSAGTLPPGVTLSTGGVLSGQLTTAGTYNFTITATDSIGASASQSYSITVTTGNFAGYTVAVQGSSTVTAGTPFIVTVQAADAFGNPITNYSGPSTVTPSLNPSSWGGTLPGSVSISQFGLGFFLASIQKAGAYTISAGSGSFTGTSGTITVQAGPAAKLGFGVQPVNTPTGVTLPAVTVQVLDAFGNVVTTDNADTVTLGIASGPGTFTSGSTTTATVHNGVATFNNLVLIKPGAYTLSDLVSGLYTGPASSTFSVIPLQVVSGSFVGTPSGFSLQFNAPILVNSTNPVLFGQGFGATAPPPSVTLTGPGGNVAGSLIVNTANNSITFVETNTTSFVNDATPLLPDGVYTVDLSSSAAKNGFQALNSGGGFLDGKGTGTPGSGDFTATFTVTAAAAHDDVIWVPPTADGPLQPLNAPGNNQIGGGYPVYIDDSTGTVTSVQVTINYNTSMLTVTGATSNSALPGSSFTLLGSSTPGHAVMQYTGSTTNATHLMGGQVALGFLTASVPNSSTATPIYHGKDLLHLSGISVTGTGGAVAVVGADAVHVVAFVGDADGNGAYSSSDAVLITRVAVSTDSGFVAYPLVDPTVVADTDGSGFIPSDAALQANEAGVGFPTANLANPPIPPGANVTAVANNVDPTLSVDRGPWTVDRSTVTVAVNLDDAHPAGSTGLVRGQLALTYDPRQLSVSAADIHLGSLLAGGGWSLVPSIDPATGQIAIALSSGTPITSTQGGSLVTIDFHTVGGNSNPSSIALVSSVTPNGQPVTTELEDAQGTFTLSQGNTVVTLTATATVGQVADLPGSGQVGNLPHGPTGTIEAISGSPDFPPAVVETTSNAAAVAAESVDPEAATVSVPVVEAAPLHVAAPIHGTAAIVAATTSSVAGSLTTLVFQMGPPIAAGPSNAALGWQHLADQLFQALARTASSANDPALVGAVQILEHALAGQLFLAQPSSENLDSFNWEDAGVDLDWQGAGRQPLSATRDQQETGSPLTTSAAEAVTTRAAVDQLFSQDADDTDLSDDSE
jgi:Putative Ig domain/Bacterial Ig-like domain (group 3)